MFEYLAVYRAIWVTGPQRAGTRIATKMIAQDIGFEFIDERDIFTDSLSHLAVALSRSRVVVQCPSLMRYAHYFGNIRHLAIVMMRRPVEEIVTSQRRIKWGYENLELLRYDMERGCISKVKYDFWDSHQKDKITNAFEVEYHDLEYHPLWLPKAERAQFNAFQTAAA